MIDIDKIAQRLNNGEDIVLDGLTDNEVYAIAGKFNQGEKKGAVIELKFMSDLGKREWYYAIMEAIGRCFQFTIRFSELNQFTPPQIDFLEYISSVLLSESNIVPKNIILIFKGIEHIPVVFFNEFLEVLRVCLAKKNWEPRFKRITYMLCSSEDLPGEPLKIKLENFISLVD